MSDNEEKHYWIGQRESGLSWWILDENNAAASVSLNEVISRWGEWKQLFKREECPSYALNSVNNPQRIFETF